MHGNFIWILVLFSFSLIAKPIVDSTVDQFQNRANYPLTGIVTITHDRNEKIDDTSFSMNGKSIDAVIVKEVPFSSPNTLVTIYNFQLPAQSAGSYTLPSITVKIDEKSYLSSPAAYEVTSNSIENFPSNPSTNQAAKGHTPTIFTLKSAVEGPSNLHPGERIKLFYRISFNKSIDLSKSDLPLIHPKHFKKVGDVRIKEYQQGDLSIQELTQEIEAEALGTFVLGPSTIEGYAYTLNRAGQKILSPTLLQATSPAVSIQVTPFPKAGQSPSFTGAFGVVEIEGTLLSSPKTTVGETLQLRLKVKGSSNLGQFHLPSLSCQPGFSGFFQMSDLPPVADFDEKNQIKTFLIELRPLTSLATQIPAIEISSYDQKKGDYVVKKTEPISIDVSEAIIPPERQAPSHLEVPMFSFPHFVQLKQGVAAENWTTREKELNAKLALNQQLLLKDPSSPDLNIAIGNAYFQLEAYPWAILYYHRALLSNRSDITLEHLNKAYQTLGLPLSTPPSPSKLIPDSLENNLLWFALLIVLLCFLAIRIPKLRYAALSSTIVIFLLLGNVVISYYLKPIEAILVSSTHLYREPDLDQPQLMKDPLFAGSKIQILQTTSNGDWVKISLPTGLVGYIPFENMRMI